MLYTETIVARVHQFTILPPERLRMLLAHARVAARMAGCIVELGSYRGGSAMGMKLAAPNSEVWAFDTFDGIPEVTESVDGHRIGDFADSDGAAERLKAAGCLPVVGRFPLSAVGVCVGPIALAHYDGDQYRSCVDFIEWVRPKMLPGGAIIFDDYGSDKCAGVAKAAHEAFGRPLASPVAGQGIYYAR